MVSCLRKTLYFQGFQSVLITSYDSQKTIVKSCAPNSDIEPLVRVMHLPAVGEIQRTQCAVMGLWHDVPHMGGAHIHTTNVENFIPQVFHFPIGRKKGVTAENCRGGSFWIKD